MDTHEKQSLKIGLSSLAADRRPLRWPGSMLRGTLTGMATIHFSDPALPATVQARVEIELDDPDGTAVRPARPADS